MGLPWSVTCIPLGICKYNKISSQWQSASDLQVWQYLYSNKTHIWRVDRQSLKWKKKGFLFFLGKLETESFKENRIYGLLEKVEQPIFVSKMSWMENSSHLEREWKYKKNIAKRDGKCRSILTILLLCLKILVEYMNGVGRKFSSFLLPFK